MAALYDALVDLTPVQDPELLEGYRRYESALATTLTPEQIETYAQYIRQSKTIRIFEEMSTEELAALPADINTLAMTIVADENLSMENRRVVSLLNQRGQHDVAPDLGDS